MKNKIDEFLNAQKSIDPELGSVLNDILDDMIKEQIEPKKHICFEASHIECSCKDKCLRNINNY